MTVDVAEDGSVALEMVGSKDYEIVLMDMLMPKMDGLTATRLIREQDRFADLPIVAMTANVMRSHQEACRAAGMNDFIGKPFEPGQLYAVIWKWVTGSANADIFDLAIDIAWQGAAVSLPGHIDGVDLRAGLRRMAGIEPLYVKSLTDFVDQQSDAVGGSPGDRRSRRRRCGARRPHLERGGRHHRGASGERSCGRRRGPPVGLRSRWRHGYPRSA